MSFKTDLKAIFDDLDAKRVAFEQALFPKLNELFNKFSNYISASLIGAANGVAPLGADTIIPAVYLPSYVDDIVEGALVNTTTFKDSGGVTVTPESGKLYVDTTTNKTYRWSGTQYSEVSKSLALGTTASTAFRGDHGLLAYNERGSQIAGTGLNWSGGNLNVDNTIARDADILKSSNSLILSTGEYSKLIDIQLDNNNYNSFTGQYEVFGSRGSSAGRTFGGNLFVFIGSGNMNDELINVQYQKNSGSIEAPFFEFYYYYNSATLTLSIYAKQILSSDQVWLFESFKPVSQNPTYTYYNNSQVLTSIPAGSVLVNERKLAEVSDIPTNNTKIANGKGYLTSADLTPKQKTISTSTTLSSTHLSNTLFLKTGASLTLDNATASIPNNFECYCDNKSGGSVTLTLTANSGWTYSINGATPIASGTATILDLGKCFIAREVANKIIYIDGDLT